MQTKTKSRLIMLIPSYIIWFLGYGLIIMGIQIGYVVEIIGAILSCIFLIRLIYIFKEKMTKYIKIVTLVITLFFLFDILANLYLLLKLFQII